MRRLKSDFENLKGQLGRLREQAGTLESGLKKEGLSSPAGKMGLVLKRLDNICGSAQNLGSTAPGLDDTTLKKIVAEWQICCRLARNTTGVGSMGSIHQRLVEGMTQTDEYLKKLLG